QYKTEFTVTPGDGIVLHAWDLISERVVQPMRRPMDPFQRNPHSLWMSVGTSADPQSPIPVSVDQCVDGLPSHLELAPLRLCQERVEEGETYTTWTYLTIKDADLRQRLNTEAQVTTPRGGRCGIEVVTQGETLRMFPTRSYRLLCRYDVAVARILDQIVI